jgi:tetratricopeptide (TPR) repeat protein
MTGPDDSGPSVVQNVMAIDGFAYGAVGADIHVFSNGLPLYLLANWQPEATPSRGWLREMPSRMLNARRAVVPFTGRASELAELREWRGGSPRLAVRWLHGPGGQGKSRLAAEFARDSAAAGWKVIAAFHGPDVDQPEPGSQDMRLDGAAGLLVLIDYADRWLMSNLTWLFKNRLLHNPGVPTRVLMLARTADSWPAIRGMLDTYQPATSSSFLLPLSPQAGERTVMFGVARDSFAAVYQVTEPAGIAAPVNLDDPEFGLILAVHMAALVAVDASVSGRRLPQAMAGLTMYLLDREQLQWRRLFDDNAAAPAAARVSYRTPPGVMNQAVFTAALTGSVLPEEGARVLADLQLPSPVQVLGDHAVCYPPAGSRDTTVLEPLYPDRLTEDFLALTMPGHAADYPAQVWAEPSATMLLTRDDDQQPPPWTPRALTFLASAALRWPHLRDGYLYPLLLRDPRLAVDAGNAALTAIATLHHDDYDDHDVVEAIFAQLPRQRRVDLDAGIAALAARVFLHRILRTRDPAAQALNMDKFGNLLANAGRHLQAVSVTQEAERIFRQLAAADPGRYEWGLAFLLANLGSRLGQQGRPAEALPPTEEAIRIQRRLAAADPVANEPSLARSLANLGVFLGDLGRRAEAVTATKEAVGIRRRLAAADPASVEPDLAATLSNLGIALSKLERRAEALAVTEEAVGIRRRLAAADPAANDPSLAAELDNLGSRLSELGRRAEALPITEEAIRVNRRLAAANPAAFEPGLAGGLQNLGIRLAEVGRWTEALTVTEDSVRLWRRLAKADPVAHEPTLAAALSDLGMRLSESGRRADAVAATEEAVRIRRRLAAADPVAFEEGLASSVGNLGVLLSDAGRRAEALAATEEAVHICRRLAAADPATFEPDLARALTNLSLRRSESGSWPEAAATAEEGITIRRRLVAANPGAFERQLARELSNLGGYLSEWRREEALAATKESLEIRRRLAAAHPEGLEGDVAASLNNLGLRLAELDRFADAVTATQEAVQIRRRLAGPNPDRFEPALAQSLNNLGPQLAKLDRYDDALAAAQEATRIYERLAAADPALFQATLAEARTSLGTLQSTIRPDGKADAPRVSTSPA